MKAIPWTQESLLCVSESHSTVAIEMHRHSIGVRLFVGAEDVRALTAAVGAARIGSSELLWRLGDGLVKNCQHLVNFLALTSRSDF